jgi:hypothetical protein
VAVDPGHELLALLRRRLVTAFHDAADALRAAGALDGLGPAGPPWTPGAVGEQLLARLDQVPVPGLQAGALLPLAGQLTSVDDGGSLVAGLYGWDPDPVGHTQPRGIAYAVRAGADPGELRVALAAVVVDGVPALELVASGVISPGEDIPLVGGWSLLPDGAVDGVLRVRFAATGAAQVSGGTPGDHVSVQLIRSAPAGPDVGVAGGPALDLGNVSVGVALALGPDGTPHTIGAVRIDGGAATLAPAGVAALIPGLGPIPLDVNLAADGQLGVSLAGSTTLKATLPVGGTLPGVQVGPLEVALVLDPAGPVGVRVAVGLAVELPGVPIRLSLGGAGLTVPFDLGDAGRFGFDPAGLLPTEPDGAGVDLALPMVSGAGLVRRAAPNEYAGALALSIPPMSAAGFGVLGLRPLSLLVLISASFPLPGIQLGFGFAVSGVGGIVGVNRRVDRDALTAAVVGGTAADLLFPADPQAAAGRVVAALPAIFPAAPGRVVLGPMFQLSWGGRLVTASVAVILELPEPVRITLLGKLVLALPDPAAPLVNIQVTIVGVVDPGVPSAWFLASLAGSSIAGVPLTGELFLLTRGGADPTFVLSAGGFHPAYALPRGVPPLRRLVLDLSPSPLLQLRCQAYLAITPNTVQFGARIDLVAEIAGCGLRGFLGFDVLVQLDPFRFVAEISAGIAVEVLGETLAGISLDLVLAGPAPWHVRGRGRVELFLFSVSFDFETGWGDPAPAPLATPDVGGILAAAFAAREAWSAQPPDPGRSPVELSASARRALADGTVVHPHGRLTGRQRRVPLGLTLGRFDRLAVAPQRWDVIAPVLADGVPAADAVEVREQFAAAAFLQLSDDEQLSRPSFEAYRAGVSFLSGDTEPAAGRLAGLEWETKVISAEEVLMPAGFALPQLHAALAVAAVARLDHPIWWQPRRDAVTIRPATFLAADTWALTGAEDVLAAAVTSVAEAQQATAATLAGDPSRRLAVVEAWEVGA